MNKYVLGAVAIAACALVPQQADANGVSLDCSGQNHCTASAGGSHDYISWDVDPQGTDAIIPYLCDGTDTCVFRCASSPGYVGVSVYIWNNGQLVGSAFSQALCSEA